MSLPVTGVAMAWADVASNEEALVGRAVRNRRRGQLLSCRPLPCTYAPWVLVTHPCAGGRKMELLESIYYLLGIIVMAPAVYYIVLRFYKNIAEYFEMDLSQIYARTLLYGVTAVATLYVVLSINVLKDGLQGVRNAIDSKKPVLESLRETDMDLIKYMEKMGSSQHKVNMNQTEAMEKFTDLLGRCPCITRTDRSGPN